MGPVGYTSLSGVLLHFAMYLCLVEYAHISSFVGTLMFLLHSKGCLCYSAMGNLCSKVMVSNQPPYGALMTFIFKTYGENSCAYLRLWMKLLDLKLLWLHWGAFCIPNQIYLCLQLEQRRI